MTTLHTFWHLQDARTHKSEMRTGVSSCERLTSSGRTAWIGAGRWVDGYPYGSGAPRSYARSALPRPFDDWRSGSESSASMLSRTNTAGGHTWVGPGGLGLTSQAVRGAQQDLEPQDSRTPRAQESQRRASRASCSSTTSRFGAAEARATDSPGGLVVWSHPNGISSLPAAPSTPPQTVRGTPYAVHNESSRAVWRADWFWNSAAGHPNELQHPIESFVASRQRSGQPVPQHAPPPSMPRLGHDWVVGPCRRASSPDIDSAALFA